MTTDMQNEPVKKFRIGAVTATIWKNETEGRSFYNTTIVRSYGTRKPRSGRRRAATAMTTCSMSPRWRNAPRPSLPSFNPKRQPGGLPRAVLPLPQGARP